jgi:hypothetical protein
LKQFRKLLRYGLPFVVSGGLLAWLLTSFDFKAVLDSLTLEMVGVLLPSLLVYGVVSLFLEAQSLLRVFASSERPIDARTGAQVRAASYLFTLLNYAVGAGVMAVLLRRRTGLTLADSAGAVAFVSAMDLGILLILGAVVLIEPPLGRAGLVLLVIGGIAGGIALLRSPRDLGPLEQLRSLALFRAPRTTSVRSIVELIAIRSVFVASFIAVAGSSLVAFGIDVPLGPLVVGVVGIAVVSALPIALAGLGTGQAAFLYMFAEYADSATLLACSLALSAGLLALRGGIGLLFARELTREAMAAAREVQA